MSKSMEWREEARLQRVRMIVTLEARPAIEQWTPVRWVRTEQVCSFCWSIIPAGRPGARTGERGTKAFFESSRGLWNCCGCRLEATRAELAREALIQVVRTTTLIDVVAA